MSGQSILLWLPLGIAALLAAPPDARAQGCMRSVSPAFVTIPWDGRSAHITVTPLPGSLFCPLDFTVTPNAPWIFAGAITFDGLGGGGFDLSADINRQPLGRDGFVSVSLAAPVVSVLQAPFAGCTYAVSPPRIVAPASSATIGLTIHPDSFACPWTATSDAPWLTVGGGAGLGDGIVTLSTSANGDALPRLATVRSEGWSVTVTQLSNRALPYVELGDTRGPDPIVYDATSGAWHAFSVAVTAETGAAVSHGLADGVWPAAATITPADFNGDRLTDLLVSDAAGNWSVNISVPGAPGTFTTFGGSWPAGETPTILDSNGDGRSDVFAYSATSGAWTLKIAGPNGSLGDAGSGLWATGWQVYAARLDGDERDDLFVYNGNPSHPNQGRWFQVFSRDGGTFEYREGELRWAPGWTVIPGDFDGDGRSEIFLYGARGTGYWFLVDFPSSGVAYYGGLWAAGWEIHAADFNDDGCTDLFLYQPAAGPLGGLSFRALSSGSFSFEYVAAEMRWATGWRVSVADFDLDGISDIFLDGRADGLFAGVLTRGRGFESAYVYGSGWPVGTLILTRAVTP